MFERTDTLFNTKSADSYPIRENVYLFADFPKSWGSCVIVHNLVTEYYTEAASYPGALIRCCVTRAREDTPHTSIPARASRNQLAHQSARDEADTEVHLHCFLGKRYSSWFVTQQVP
jgi:hypothetical protein